MHKEGYIVHKGEIKGEPGILLGSAIACVR